MALCRGLSRMPGRQNLMGHQTTRVWWAQTLALWALRGGLELPLQIRGQRPPTPLPPTCLLRPAASQGPDLSLHHSSRARLLWLLPSSLLQERALLAASGLRTPTVGNLPHARTHWTTATSTWTWQAI